MTAKLRADVDETETDLTGDPFIPPATVRRYANIEKIMATNSKCEDSDLFVRQLRSVRHHVLTTPEQRTFLQNFMCMRDRANNGMERKEVIDITVELCGAKTHKEEKNNLDYFIRSGQLPEFKAGVRVICEKNTTTKHSFMCIKHQLRWYMVVQFTRDKLKRLNLTAEEYQSVKAHFM